MFGKLLHKQASSEGHLEYRKSLEKNQILINSLIFILNEKLSKNNR